MWDETGAGGNRDGTQVSIFKMLGNIGGKIGEEEDKLSFGYEQVQMPASQLALWIWHLAGRELG